MASSLGQSIGFFVRVFEGDKTAHELHGFRPFGEVQLFGVLDVTDRAVIDSLFPLFGRYIFHYKPYDERVDQGRDI